MSHRFLAAFGISQPCTCIRILVSFLCCRNFTESETNFIHLSTTVPNLAVYHHISDSQQSTFFFKTTASWKMTPSSEKAEVCDIHYRTSTITSRCVQLFMMNDEDLLIGSLSPDYSARQQYELGELLPWQFVSFYVQVRFLVQDLRLRFALFCYHFRVIFSMFISMVFGQCVKSLEQFAAIMCLKFNPWWPKAIFPNAERMMSNIYNWIKICSFYIPTLTVYLYHRQHIAQNF